MMTQAVDVPRPVLGRATVALGVLHTLATLPAVVAAAPYVLDRGVLGGIATQVPPPADAMPALAALFSMVVGVLLLVAGGLLARLERAGIAPPAWIGPAFAVTGLVGGVLMPPTGFWLVLALGVWMTLRRR